MRERSILVSRVALAALTGVLALSAAATSASAGHGKGHWKHGHGRVRYVVVQQPHVVVVRPAYEEAFVVHRPTFVVARPVPVWATPYGSGVSGAVGIHTGGVNLNVAFNNQRPYYGCSFCDAYFPTYGGWQGHVQHCGARPYGRVLYERWDDDQLQACRAEAYDAWSQRYGDRYDNGRYREDDQGEYYGR
jgi:hypothetical protein